MGSMDTQDSGKFTYQDGSNGISNNGEDRTEILVNISSPEMKIPLK